VDAVLRAPVVPTNVVSGEISALRNRWTSEKYLAWGMLTEDQHSFVKL
jgi:hypothetical protein